MNSIFVKCPFHEQDKTPSLSILLQDRGNLRAGFAHCFACGWSGNYKQVEEALGYPLPIDPEIRSVMEKGQHTIRKSTSTLRTAVAQDTLLRKDELPFRYSRYLESRGIGEVIQRYNKVYQSELLTMPFFNPYGQYIGSVARSVTENKFYQVNGTIEYPLGIEEIRPEDFVYVTEGQIDMMSLQECDCKAVSLGSVSNYKTLKHLKNLNVCLAFDNDEAGQKAVELTSQYLKSLRGLNVYRVNIPHTFYAHDIKDVNDLLRVSDTIYPKRESRLALSLFIRQNTLRI